MGHGSLGGRRLDVELAHRFEDGALLTICANQAARRKRLEISDGDVGAHRQVEQQAVALAVLGEERNAGVAGISRRAYGDGLAIDHYRALGRHTPEDAVEDFAAARAEEAREADDLACSNTEADIARAVDGARLAGDIQMLDR